MKSQLAIALFCCALTVTVVAQKRVFVSTTKKSASTCTSKKRLVNITRPAAYLTFLRHERIDPEDKSDDAEFLFFKLTNNSCWSIWLDESGVASKRFGDSSLYYVIENEKTGEKLSGSIYCHVCSHNLLRSGRSIMFSIPLKEASRDALMRISYEFDWEQNTFGDFENSNTQHTVTYYFSGLPESVLPKSVSP